ncbi:glycerol acyltransferase [Aliihoeflea aestuarii]|jgi:putative hemolysin|uniref:lysophospholipid acyltransferase family protein n=1 Tax=Aliihoeflea aestuarii TaxID=453840 RepID=UPI0020932D89|nr:lysophospholipid acyltransferase family protein [Aliihoeflea aestuarii]MCO6390465.1 glycerol acyltransferase [Aliihoeflea aestuarii]
MKTIVGHALFPELTYANDGHSRLQRFVIEAIETLAGRNRLASLYDSWRREVVPSGDAMFQKMLAMVGIELRLSGTWPPSLPDTPLVMVANHPFGIADGIAILSLAERLGRPFRVMIHSDLLKVEEMRPYALPIDFSDTREAMANNLAVRHEAVALLRQGVTIVIFPAGGVSTAARGFGKAQDLPWKTFAARLVKDARASVMPLYFSGQNSLLFHLATRVSMTLRLSLLVPEFVRRMGKPIDVTIGRIIPADALAELDDRKAILQTVHRAVFSLAK